MTPYALVCEGLCSPDLAKVESRVRAYRRRELALTKGYAPVPPPLASALRAASTHTRHRLVGPYEAECMVCHHRRKF